MLLISCSTSQSKVDHIEFGDNDVSQLRDSFEYKIIPLETTDDALIRNIGEVVICGDTVFVLDVIQGKIFAFNLQGHFIKQLGQKGEGPKGYVSPNSISLTPGKDKIMITDISQQAILNYDRHSLEFMDKISVPFNFRNSKPLSDSTYIFFSKVGYPREEPETYFITTDLGFNVLKKGCKSEFFSGYGYGFHSYFYQYNDSVYLYPPYEGRIYNVSDSEFELAWDFSFQTADFPTISYLKSNSNKENFITNLFNSDYITDCKIEETNRILFIQYIHNGKLFLGFYDKKNKLNYTCTLSELIEILDLQSMVGICGSTDEYLISAFNPVGLSDRLERVQGKGRAFNTGSDDIVDESNPNLILFKLK
ncbi:MAG: 6-bladed beta-propeller [Bacteroidales bacterium]